MDTQQIADYLEKYNIKSKEQLASHIRDLKKNTFPKIGLISELVWVLEDENSFFSSFSAEKVKKEPIFKDNKNFDETWTVKNGEKEIINNEQQEKRSAEHIDEVLEELENNTKNNCCFTKCGQKNCDCCYPINKGMSTRHKAQQEKEVIDNWEKPEGVNEGIKLNKLKPQLSLLFKQFPQALEAISRCSEYGHEKYKETDLDYLNFKRVKEGSKAYADAGLRHRLQKGIDLESMLPHCYHVAWNALAELELILENK